MPELGWATAREIPHTIVNAACNSDGGTLFSEAELNWCLAIVFRENVLLEFGSDS